MRIGKKLILELVPLLRKVYRATTRCFDFASQARAFDRNCAMRVVESFVRAQAFVKKGDDFVDFVMTEIVIRISKVGKDTVQFFICWD